MAENFAAVLRAAREYAVGALMVANVYDNETQTHEKAREHRARANGAIYVIALIEGRQPTDVFEEVLALVNWSTG